MVPLELCFVFHSTWNHFAFSSSELSLFCVHITDCELCFFALSLWPNITDVRVWCIYYGHSVTANLLSIQLWFSLYVSCIFSLPFNVSCVLFSGFTGEKKRKMKRRMTELHQVWHLIINLCKIVVKIPLKQMPWKFQQCLKWHAWDVKVLTVNDEVGANYQEFTAPSAQWRRVSDLSFQYFV